MSVYTKRGDSGETSLYQPPHIRPKRIKKDDPIIETLGAIDELNSYLGITRLKANPKTLRKEIVGIQRDLLTMGSILAGSKLDFPQDKVLHFEKVIDDLEGKLPVLANFILPGGCELAANLHHCRAISRRVERRLVKLSNTSSFDKEILRYINRLSDLFFTLARWENYQVEIKEEIWKGYKNR